MFTDLLHHALMIFKLGLVWLQKALDSNTATIIGDSCVNVTEYRKQLRREKTCSDPLELDSILAAAPSPSV